MLAILNLFPNQSRDLAFLFFSTNVDSLTSRQEICTQLAWVWDSSYSQRGKGRGRPYGAFKL